MHQLNVAVIADFEIVKQEQAMWLKGLLYIQLLIFPSILELTGQAI